MAAVAAKRPSLNLIDKVVSFFSPQAGVGRMAARAMLSHYEMAAPSKRPNTRGDASGPNVSTTVGTKEARQQARHLERNHDISNGALDALVKNVIGHAGIQVEPMPRDKDGNYDIDFAKQILKIWDKWSERPEVTGTMDRPAMERMVARSKFRDGEVIGQMLFGNVAGLRHGSKVPFSIECVEADHLPLNYRDDAKSIRQGIQRNDWGRATFYHLYKNHPGDSVQLADLAKLVAVPAERILHPRLTTRFGHLRGVSIFASIINRLFDIKDYEESERVAAKIAASIAAFIKKGDAGSYSGDGLQTDENGNAIPRDFRFQPGMVFDGLVSGEEIGMIDTNRPNSGLEAFRDGQLRAAAHGFKLGFSTLAKKYHGSYSALRQENIDQWGGYYVLTADLVCEWTGPCFKNVVRMAVLSGELVVPEHIDRDSIDDALYLGPQMPFIDPDKEAKAHERAENNLHMSGLEINRRRGVNPWRVIDQESAWRKYMEEKEVVYQPNGTPVNNEISVEVSNDG